MPVIFDIEPLLRPPFTPEQFTPTKWETAADKAAFGNKLCRFIAADFKNSLFTDALYRRLANTFGHIAHYNKQGFASEFFENLHGKVAFLEQTLLWTPCGDPAWTYVDVERAVQKRLHKARLLAAYRALRAAEIEGAERALLTQLQAKYTGSDKPAARPVIHRPEPAKNRRNTVAGQAALF